MNPFRSPRAKQTRTPLLAQAPTPKGAGTVTLRLYDVIDSWGGDWGVSAKEFASVIDGLPDDTTEIRVLINSPGGEVWDGMAIVNQLRAHPARIVAVVEGIAASAASFIAASADELVMMRNSELFVHKAWGIVMGNSDDMDAASRDLTTLDRNIAQIYADKSGQPIEHWLQVMADETLMSAETAVEQKLADRIEGVGDASSARARFDLSVFASSRAHAPKPPIETPEPPATEPGDPNRKELPVSDILQAGLRERLGVTDADASDETLLAALDETLAEQASSTPTTVPEGVVMMDANALADLRAAAEMGRQARAEQDRVRREGIVAQAVSEGRIAPASRETWLAQLAANEEGTSALLASLTPNTIPVAELGHSDEPDDADRQYAAAWGDDEKKGA